MKHHWYRIVMLFVVVCFLASCGSTSPASEKDAPQTTTEDTAEKIYAEMQIEYVSFEAAVRQSDVGVRATFRESINGKRDIQYVFDVQQVLYGPCTEEQLHVYSPYADCTVTGGEKDEYAFQTGTDIYKAGQSYILLLDRADLIFYDYPRFTTYADLMMAEDENIFTMYGEPLSFGSSTPVDAILAWREGVPEKTVASLLSGEDEVETMVLNAEHIAIVKLVGIDNAETYHNGIVYIAKTEKRFTEKKMCTKEDGTFLLVLDRETTQVGDCYLVGFDAIGGSDSLIYIQSTPSGLFEADNEEVIARVGAYLASK